MSHRCRVENTGIGEHGQRVVLIAIQEFERAKEERPVAPDGPAERSTELLPAALGFMRTSLSLCSTRANGSAASIDDGLTSESPSLSSDSASRRAV